MNELKKLPYVDSDTPEEGQQSIKWIKNGDLLIGGTKENPRSGNLNEDGIAIQKNVVVIDDNVRAINNEVQTNIVDIENLKELLGASGSTELFDKVNKNTSDIENLDSRADGHDVSISELNTKNSVVEELVGQKIPQSVDRTVTEDLFWIKTEIGQYTDKDINGVDVGGNQATGLKLRFEDLGFQSNKNKDDIAIIKEQILTGNFDEIKTNIDNLRSELGPSTEAVTGTPVYSRVKLVEDATTSLQQTTNSISDAIGLNSGKIIDKVNTLNDNFNTLNDDVNGTNGIEERLAGVHNDIWNTDTGLIKVTTTNTTSIGLLQENVGTTDDEGLRKRIKVLEDSTGTSENPDPASLEGRVRTLTSIQNEQASTIQDLQIEVNDLKLKVDDLISRFPPP